MQTIKHALALAISRLSSNRLTQISGLLAHAIEKREHSFVTCHQRPRQTKTIGTFSDANMSGVDMAIVIQGPLVSKDNFTLETVCLYRKHFPEAQLIVSTWLNESSTLLRKIRDSGAVVVLNEPPTISGPANINRQLVSSFAGIQKAHELGNQYVLKTRTDQRIYAPNALQFLLNISKSFPLRQATVQMGRLVGCSLGTLKYRLYGVSDMLLFGKVEDMLLFWGAPLDNRDADSQPSDDSVRSFCRWCACEVYLVTHFLQLIGCSVKWTLEDSFRVFAEHFCIVDRECIDLFWPKYLMEAEFRGLRYDGIFTDQPLTFRDWLLLYSGALTATPEQEQCLNLPFRSPLQHP